MQRQLKLYIHTLYTTLCFKTIDVIDVKLSTCTRIDAHVSGTLEMREMCP